MMPHWGKHIAAFVLALACGIAIGAYYAGGSTLRYSTMSPDGKERVDFYNVNRWQALRSYGSETPTVIRLVRLAGDETLGTSGVIDLIGGSEVLWDKKQVQISTVVVFDRDSGKWNRVD